MTAAALLPVGALLSYLALLTGFEYLLLRRPPRRLVPACLGALAALPLLHELAVWAGWLGVPRLRVDSILTTALVPLITALVAWRLRALPAVGAGRRLLVEVLTAAAALCLGLAAMDLKVAQSTDKQALILVVDRSRSIDRVAEAPARLRDELRVAELGMRSEDLLGVVGFGADAVLEEPLRARSGPQPSVVSEVAQDATNIEAGLRRALAEAPTDAATRLVLLSDGVATNGDAEAGAAAALAAGIPIDVIPLDQAPVKNVGITSLRAPAQISAHEPVELTVALRSTQHQLVTLELSLDGHTVGRAAVEVPAGEVLHRLTRPAPEPGLHHYEVRLTELERAVDALASDNQASAFVRVRGAGTVLVVGESEALRAAFVAAGLETRVASALTMPSAPTELAAYDLVVLNNVPAWDLSSDQLRAIAVYCSSLAGGVLLMGGDRSFGPGGYAATPIEAISPVSFDLKQDRRRASLAEVILIDYSGSMSAAVGGKTKLELANEAAVRSLELLGRGDRIGVAHVDTSATWTVPLSAPTDWGALAPTLRAVGPGGGGIAVDTALRAGYSALAKEVTQLKHVLLFADGADAVERTAAPRLAERAYAEGITTSVVALGHGKDVPALEHLSMAGHGRFYLVEDAERLPAVFAQETVLAARSAIVETSFRALPLGDAGALRGIDFTAAPHLLGYVITIPKPRAELLLQAPESDPLLAIGHAGVGKVGVFTTDYAGRWGAPWAAWPGASSLFGQLARILRRPADDPGVSLSATSRGNQIRVTAKVRDARGSPESGRDLTLQAVGPGDFERSVTLPLTGRGVYSVAIEAASGGVYAISARDRQTGLQLAQTAVMVDARAELDTQGSNRRMLRRLAALSGGRERDTLAGVFEERPPRVVAQVSLLDPLLISGALAMLLAVAARRLVVPKSLSRLLARSLTKRATPRTPKSFAGSGSAVVPNGAPATNILSEPRPAQDTPATEVPERSPLPPPPVQAGGGAPVGRQSPSTAAILLERRRRRG